MCLYARAQPERSEIPIAVEKSLTVSGTVTSAADGRAIVGATVTNGRTRIHAITDRLGEYRISAQAGDILVFSFVGYKERKEAINGRASVDVSMETADNTLDETVVIAYGTTSRRLNTGSVGRVTSQTIAKQPVGNPLLALAGRIPGLEINQTNGLPGSTVNVRIRGRNSIQQGNEPMYIIDGVPWLSSSLTQSQTRGAAGDISPFNSINPADIESIEVLKDADATAIYGSRGANGVILITTKRGKAGRTSVDVNLYTGMGRVTRTMELMNTQQYLEMRREAFRNDGVEPTPANAPDLLLWDTTRYVDWKKLMIGNTAKLGDVQVALSGGSEGTQFRLAGSYRRETTVFPGDDLADRRGAAQLNINHRSADDRLQANVSVGYSGGKNNLITSDLTGQIYTPPVQPAYDASGKLMWSDNGSSFVNPLRYLDQKNTSLTQNLISNLNVQYDIGFGLQLKANTGYTVSRISAERITPNAYYGPSAANRNWGASAFSDANAKSWIIEPQLSYAIALSDADRIQALVGATLRESINDLSAVQASDYSNEALLGTINGAASLVNSASHDLYRYQSFFGRINYNRADKYLLNFTARRDGSSRFGTGRQYANFGAVGAAWIFTKESWFENTDGLLSFGKVRGSYGITGNDNIGNYQYLDTYGTTNPYQGIAGLYPNRLFNADYAWETNRKLEAALDLGFVNDRLLASVAWFRNRSGNQLLQDALPTQVGFSNITRNLPALVQNTGWEFELHTVPIQRPDFSWSSEFNLTLSRNKLLEYPGLAESNNASRYEVGKPLDIVRLWLYTGVDPATGLHTVDMETGQTVFYDITPRYYGGWNHTLTYRGFEASIFVQFVKQKKVNGLATLINAPGHRYNVPALVVDRWQQPGDISSTQRYATGGDAAMAFLRYRASTDAYTDASFIRLKNVSLAYQLTGLAVGNWHLNRCRIYAQGQNLLTLTRYVGNDPETGNANILPPLRMVTMGIQITL
ncbi:SusC/RagA family TonB-linked outer membrane protein [Parapedobacter pyrenivorans]|uniref:SusC/RagA family TonB-linked outer membrane protein n=2 Tax=Parapedobacter pyrenivorans TaxID=1305674 RepID=A0A917MBM9_9SPHI|nr:SusC/RagA family TonB-linked outer membrane protein [Parapedobacter pyrenivorans]